MPKMLDRHSLVGWCRIEVTFCVDGACNRNGRKRRVTLFSLSIRRHSIGKKKKKEGVAFFKKRRKIEKNERGGGQVKAHHTHTQLRLKKDGEKRAMDAQCVL